ncbi:hypothetical protein Nepgr_025579 [Nepenthes gracilis]|uniref:RNase H type-1 domain-containing protein n=1 Tax=Nepenthes gracilis TaxID=150966 RepID=A0AAD3T815_NEPGR|nr:hypothetical protein Nepgr_025579 [Nepenthes gracilis]
MAGSSPCTISAKSWLTLRQAIQDSSNTCDAKELHSPMTLTLHVDGSSMKDCYGVGVVLRTPEGSEIKNLMVLGFPATNNATEYEALLAGLRLAKECSAKNQIAYSDYELVVN